MPTDGATPYSVDMLEVGICTSFQFLRKKIENPAHQHKQGAAFGREFLRYCFKPHQ